MGKGYLLLIRIVFIVMSIKTSNKLIAPNMFFCYGKLKSLSKEFSRIFGYSRKDGELRFGYLIGACLNNTSISDYCVDNKKVSADTILKLGRIPLESMVEKCNRLIGVSVRMGLRSGVYRNCDLSVDYHDMPYHGKKNDSTIKVLVKGKYRRCYRYAVSALTGPGRFLCTGINMYKEGMGNAVMVESLLNTVPEKYGLVLMDRYFTGVDVFDIIEEKNRDFLTPYKINNKTDQLYLASLLDGKKVKPYIMRKHNDKGSKKVNMYLEPDENDEYHAYVSNLKKVLIKDHYPFRWNIENAFKTMITLKPVTSTTHESFRILLMTLSLILASLWKFLVIMKEHITIKKFKKRLSEILYDINNEDVSDRSNRKTVKS